MTEWSYESSVLDDVVVLKAEAEEKIAEALKEERSKLLDALQAEAHSGQWSKALSMIRESLVEPLEAERRQAVQQERERMLSDAAKQAVAQALFLNSPHRRNVPPGNLPFDWWSQVPSGIKQEYLSDATAALTALSTPQSEGCGGSGTIPTNDPHLTQAGVTCEHCPGCPYCTQAEEGE